MTKKNDNAALSLGTLFALVAAFLVLATVVGPLADTIETSVDTDGNDSTVNNITGGAEAVLDLTTLFLALLGLGLAGAVLAGMLRNN